LQPVQSARQISDRDIHPVRINILRILGE